MRAMQVFCAIWAAILAVWFWCLARTAAQKMPKPPGFVWLWICQSCGEQFYSRTENNVLCLRCEECHIYCQACWAVHRVSASEESHYLAALEEQQ